MTKNMAGTHLTPSPQKDNPMTNKCAKRTGVALSLLLGFGLLPSCAREVAQPGPVKILYTGNQAGALEPCG